MLGHLLKVYFKNSFSFKKLFGFDLKKNKVKTVLIALALVYALVVLVGLMGWLFFDLGRVLNDMGQIQILLSFLGVFLIVFPVFLTLFLASGSLFYYKDYDIVGHLPIKSRTIFLAKLIVMISFLYVITILATLPLIFSYFYWQGFDLLSLIFVILLSLVLPLIAIAVFSLLSLLIAIVTAKLRFGKIIYIVLMFVMLFGFMILMFQFNEVDVNPLTGQIELFEGLGQAYPPLKWFIDAISNHDWLSFVYLLGSHGLVFAGFVFGAERLAQYTNKRGIKTVTHSNKSTVKLQQSDIVLTLIKKEFKRLFAGVNYALNTLFGVVIVIVLSIASLFYSEEIVGLLSAEMGGLIEPELIVLLLIGFSISMTTTPAVSLSLEGKNLWIVKSLPIASHKLMYAKIGMNVLLIIPMAVIGTILFGVSIQISVFNQIGMIILFLIFGLATSLMYSVINMLIPKFSFSNEVEVVKQSLSVLFAILAGFALLALNGLLFHFVLADLPMTASLFILAGINLLWALPFWYVVRFQSAKMFHKYQA